MKTYFVFRLFSLIENNDTFFLQVLESSNYLGCLFIGVPRTDGSMLETFEELAEGQIN
jgi:hypothetical protein